MRAPRYAKPAPPPVEPLVVTPDMISTGAARSGVPYLYVVDASGQLARAYLPRSMQPGEVALLPPGVRSATPTEIVIDHARREVANERAFCHGASAIREATIAPAYELAFEIGTRPAFEITRADLDELNVAARGHREQPQTPWRTKFPIMLTVASRVRPHRGRFDVEAELAAMLEHVNALAAAGQCLDAAVYVHWRVSFLHPFRDGNGRTSRAAAYACLVAGYPQIREAHARRRGITGRRDLLIWPESVENARGEYVAAQNEAHYAAMRIMPERDGDEAMIDPFDPGYLRHPDLSRFRRYVAGIVDDILAGRETPETDGPWPTHLCPPPPA